MPSVQEQQYLFIVGWSGKTAMKLGGVTGPDAGCP